MPTRQRILVLSPHPDDETFGCGGTIKLLADAGAVVDVAFITRGEYGVESGLDAPAQVQDHVAKIRMLEAEAACKRLGVSKFWFTDSHDGNVTQDAGLAMRLAQAIQATAYRRIFCPHPAEKHPDHAATFSHFRNAAQMAQLRAEIWLYEVWTPLHPNMIIPIDNIMDEKIAAMRCYESQLAMLNYLAAFQGLAAYRALSLPPSRFAEAFFVCNADSL